MAPRTLILDHVYRHETERADQVYLTQPIGGGATVDYTWREAMDQARRMATHLQRLGLRPGDRIAMLSKNCAHFFIAELAIWMGGYTTVAIYPTEKADTIAYVLEHSGAAAILIGKLDAGWERQLAGVPDALPRILLPLAPELAGPRWDDVIRDTQPLAGRPARAADDLAMLLYTSGSTGTPKGVMHDFAHVTDASEGIVRGTAYTANDRVLSYLPLAHVFERAYIECASFVAGFRVYFAEALDTFVADLQRARPTLFLSVPRLWLKFQQGVFAKMPAKKLDTLLRIPLLGRIIARKVLTGLGLDQVRLAGSGSAPIPAELITWYRRLGLNLLEGYAMSEDFAYSHLSTATHNRPGFVGVPYPDVQVRIGDDGEILVKSPGCMVGYYKLPELTAQSFTADGYFRTGDRGERLPDGLLRITGRVKELFKTAKGKYVSPAPIENRVNEHEAIELSCVTGVGQPAAYALVVLAEHLRPKTRDPAVRAEIEAALTDWLAIVNRGLAEHERLQLFVVSAEPWSIEAGTLTPTMKIKRSRIEELAAPHVEGWYAAGLPVLWQ